MTPEAKLYQRIKRNLTQAILTRIESRVNLGTPDLLVALNSKFLMVELKVVAKGLKVNLSPHQISYHVKHATAGCPTFIVVEYHPSATAKQPATLRLYSNHQTLDLVEHGVKLEPMACYQLNAIDWPDLALQLTKKSDQ